MSLKGGAVPQDLVDWVADRFAGEETQLLHRMWKRAEEAGLPMIMIAPEQARLLRILARATDARRALDVGTLFGYSAANLALAMPEDARVTTVDVEARCTQVAKENFEDLGIEDRIKAVTAPALDTMRGYDDDLFDLVLVDADKANYVDYLEESVRIVRSGGVVAFDNAFAFGRLLDDRVAPDDADAVGIQAIRDFDEAFARHERVTSLVLPVGDGFAIGVVR